MSYAVMRRRAAARTLPQGEDGEDGALPFVAEETAAHLVPLAARLFARALQERLGRHGVSVAQWSMLLLLWEEDGLTQKELGRRQRIEEPTAARTLQRMERDGLVRRLSDGGDRRRRRVLLTERGRLLRDELVPAALEVNAVATHGLSPDDKQRLVSLLRYMIARLG